MSWPIWKRKRRLLLYWPLDWGTAANHKGKVQAHFIRVGLYCTLNCTLTKKLKMSKTWCWLVGGWLFNVHLKSKVSNLKKLECAWFILSDSRSPLFIAGEFDMRVKSCEASDNQNRPIQLSDGDGCVLRPKMVSKFMKMRSTDPRATVVTYAFFHAFKFPDSMAVHIKCKVEICR